MNAQIKLFRVFGIPIGLNYSWLLIAFLVVFSLASQFNSTNPQWGATVIWSVAVLTTLLFFAAIIVHELSHAAVARARGLPVGSITLFAFGGIAEIEREAADAKTEFWMGIVGPITSAIIGIVCLGIAIAIGWSPTLSGQSPLAAMLGWLGVINIALAIFNMIPGFPLDGGRVLRAIVWWLSGNAARATRVATAIGQFVAFVFILFGLFRFFNGAGLAGLWLTFIGWFLLNAARSNYAQFEILQRLRGLHAGDVMTNDWPAVEGTTNLQRFVDDYLLRTGKRCLIVEEGGHFAGLVTAHEVKNVERERWPQLTVHDVMLPLSKLHAIRPLTDLSVVLETMGREDVNQLPVIGNGHLAGIISRGDILRLLQTRAELKI